MTLHLVPDEGPREHIANARQMVASFVFLNDTQRTGDEAVKLLQAIERRLKLAAEQLEPPIEVVEHPRRVENPSAAWNPYDLPTGPLFL